MLNINDMVNDIFSQLLVRNQTKTLLKDNQLNELEKEIYKIIDDEEKASKVKSTLQDYKIRTERLAFKEGFKNGAKAILDLISDK